MAPDHEAEAFVFIQSDADRARWDAETIGRLAGGIAHDFNNHLTIIGGYLELIAEAAPDGGLVHRQANKALRAVGRCTRIASQLLAFGRAQVLEPIECNMNHIIDGADTLLQQAVGGAFALRFDEAPDLWPVEVDPLKLVSAVLNLLLNSREAMPPGGTVKVSTANVVIDGTHAARLGEIPPGRYVMVAVNDDGAGMTDEVRRNAIEPFFTTRRDGRHSGLGLSQVYGFIRQSRGQIEISSRPGVGTTVRLFLPAVELQAQKKSGPEGPRVDGQ